MIQRVVVCAAIRRSIQPNVIVAGARHFDTVMRKQIELIDGDYTGWNEQGFIDQWGVFIARTEAWKIADAAGQICRSTAYEKEFAPRAAGVGDEGILFSENLY